MLYFRIMSPETLNKSRLETTAAAQLGSGVQGIKHFVLCVSYREEVADFR